MNIVIVEDHDMFRDGLIDYIENVLHYAVIVFFTNGDDFIKNIYNYKYDIILMDINMPLLDGFQATKKYDWVFSKISKILAVTMNTDIVLKELIEHGFKGCVFKDEIVQHLDIAIITITNGGYYWPDEITTQ